MPAARARPMKLALLGAALAAVVALMACGPMPAEAGGGAGASAAPKPDPLDGILAAVRADAARAWQLADAGALAVQSEPVTWSDGALGCAVPGRFYTQALVPGWRIVVRDGARERVYHASQRGQWLECPAGRAARPLPGAATR